MKQDLLARLNTERTARRACLVVTRLSDGAQELLLADAMPGSAKSPALQTALASGKSGLVEIDGEAHFVAVHRPPPRVIVCGAVHISQAMAAMARTLELDLAIIDPRTAFATPERFPDVRLIADWPDAALPQLGGLDRYTAFAALTHDPKIDDPGLIAALNAGCFYVGALGSRKTHAGRLERLAVAGVAPVALARIKAPIGLDIGAISPAEIALAVLGEIIAARRENAQESAKESTA
ncbi:MAG: XdhC family protein [Bosea sp. (in: a-proteobacteria)]